MPCFCRTVSAFRPRRPGVIALTKFWTKFVAFIASTRMLAATRASTCKALSSTPMTADACPWNNTWKRHWRNARLLRKGISH